MKRMNRFGSLGCLPTLCALTILSASACPAENTDLNRLVAAMLGETPVVEDLRSLTDRIGGRTTGSPENEAAIRWALDTFRRAGIGAHAEKFEMPMQWQERAATAMIDGDATFRPRVVAKPFSAGTGKNGLSAPLRNGGSGSPGDFDRLGDQASGAWLVVETAVLDDEVGLDGLFAEYGNAAAVERRALEAGVAGIVFASSRRNDLLYRLVASRGPGNRLPLLIMEREEALRALRLLRRGDSLRLNAVIDIDGGHSYESRNVIGEIRGADSPDEIVIAGAHLDSHDLGTGALDNGANVAMLIDIARQMKLLGLQPRRTIRFALWNGEEQGLVGSWRYTEQHDAELDRIVVASAFDIGTGAITGFFTGGRARLVPIVDDYLRPVAGLGPFQQVDVPVVGTDNFDFMIEGVPNLVAFQDDANYASNYHAESDTFDKVDTQQLKRNSAIAAALIWGFANNDGQLPRQTHEEIVTLIEHSDLEKEMRDFAVWEQWKAGTRGRHD